MNSSVSAFRAMIAALLAAEDTILGRDRTWHAVNAKQERLLAEIFPAMRPENVSIPEIEQEVSWEAEAINEFLRRHGMDIRLEPFTRDTFGFAAVMRVAVQWLIAGVERDIVGIDGKTYAGARIEQEHDYTVNGLNLEFLRSPSHPNPIVTLRTKSKDVVHLTRFDGEASSAFDLMAYAGKLLTDTERSRDYEGVHFPMVDLDVQPDVSWLLNMWTTQRASELRAVMVQAVQQCKLQMNHEGAVATDAFAGAATLECCRMPKPDLVINGPFLFVLERPGLQQPMFVAHVCPDMWKNPGELDLG